MTQVVLQRVQDLGVSLKHYTNAGKWPDGSVVDRQVERSSVLLELSAPEFDTVVGTASVEIVEVQDVDHPGLWLYELKRTDGRWSTVMSTMAEPAQETPKPIEWELAVAMITDGSVLTVMQSHSLVVWLKRHDGRQFSTREPSIDAVWQVVKQIDPKGERIRYITE